LRGRGRERGGGGGASSLYSVEKILSSISNGAKKNRKGGRRGKGGLLVAGLEGGKVKRANLAVVIILLSPPFRHTPLGERGTKTEGMFAGAFLLRARRKKRVAGRPSYSGKDRRGERQEKVKRGCTSCTRAADSVRQTALTERTQRGAERISS